MSSSQLSNFEMLLMPRGPQLQTPPYPGLKGGWGSSLKQTENYRRTSPAPIGGAVNFGYGIHRKR